MYSDPTKLDEYKENYINTYNLPSVKEMIPLIKTDTEREIITYYLGLFINGILTAANIHEHVDVQVELKNK